MRPNSGDQGARAIRSGSRPTQRSRELSDLEKTFLVMASAERAFELLSDPVRLGGWVPTLRLEDSTAIDGADDADAELGERSGAPAVPYTADRTTGRIAWGRPEPDYGGSIDIVPGTTRTASVTVRLHTSGRADDPEVGRIFDAAIANMRRLLSER